MIFNLSVVDIESSGSSVDIFTSEDSDNQYYSKNYHVFGDSHRSITHKVLLFASVSFLGSSLTLWDVIVCGRATSSVRSKAEPWNEGGDVLAPLGLSLSLRIKPTEIRKQNGVSNRYQTALHS